MTSWNWLEKLRESSCKGEESTTRRNKREIERKQERKKERKRKPTMNSSKNLIKYMYHQDLLVLNLRRMKEEEKRKKKQGKQARN